EVGEIHVKGPELFKETSEKTPIIQQRIRTAFNRQKSYSDMRRRDISFKVGDYVFLKISPIKGVIRFGKKGKLTPRYIGSFKILERVGNVSYRLALLLRIGHIHPIFHISILKKYVLDLSHELQIQDVEVGENLSYAKILVAIIDTQIRKLKNKEIEMVK